MADRLDLDPALVRIGYAILALVTGIFPLLVLYVIMVVVIPEEPSWAGVRPVGPQPGGPTWAAGGPPAGAAPTPSAEPSADPAAPAGAPPAPAMPGAVPGWIPPGVPPVWDGGTWRDQRSVDRAARRAERAARRAERRSDPMPAIIAGLFLVALGAFFLLRNTFDIDWAVVWPVVIIAFGVVVLIAAIRPRSRVTDGPGLVIAAAGAGIAGGLFLLVRGLLAYRAGEAVRGTGTSRIESLAAGEVRLVGTIEPGPVTLVSPLQSVPCVYYHARISEDRGRERTTTLDEERAVGFLLRDATGTLRVFPRGARWDAPACFHEQSDWAGDDPPGLNLNRGPGVTSAVLDREAAIAALLTVHAPDGGAADEPRGILDGGALAALAGSAGGGLGRRMAGARAGRRRHYEERRLAPGDVVTIVGSAVPFRDIDDPATADRDDPLARARRPGGRAETWPRPARPGLLKGSAGGSLGQRGDPRLRDRTADPRPGPGPRGTAACRSRRRAPRRRPPRPSTSPPGELVMAVDTGQPARRPRGQPGRSRRARPGCAQPGADGRRDRDRRRARPRPCRPGGIRVSPLAGAALFAVVLVALVLALPPRHDVQRGRRPAHADRQGLGQRGGRPEAALTTSSPSSWPPSAT